ncbi:MAG TPA: PPOX class F420-dependent oxidoreductase [Ktedonobacterales bacterium]|jgi:PPOX class probable F420-dependent enzyme|nr:PPOX class F420-dependent oxidoreductase [Ktedonobacterales bacterium]
MPIDAKLRDFLNEKRFAVLATINADGSPQQTVMWYELRGDTIVMNTTLNRVKGRNLQRDPRISVCFEDGYRFVTISGAAELRDDQPTAQADIRALAIRYHGQEDGDRQAREVFAKQERVSIYLPATHVIVKES